MKKIISFVFKAIFAAMVLVIAVVVTTQLKNDDDQRREEDVRQKNMKGPAELNAALNTQSEGAVEPVPLQCKKYIKEVKDDMTGEIQLTSVKDVGTKDVRFGVRGDIKNDKIKNISLAITARVCTEGGKVLIKVGEDDVRSLSVRRGYENFNCSDGWLPYKVIDVTNKTKTKKEIESTKFLAEKFVEKIRFDTFKGWTEYPFNGDEAGQFKNAFQCAIDRVVEENGL